MNNLDKQVNNYEQDAADNQNVSDGRAEKRSATSGVWKHVFFPSASYNWEEPVLLEGRIAGFDDGKKHPTVLLHHPNPHGGGSMDNKILRAIADALYPLGVGLLRYNTRGVGRSGGKTLYVPESQGWVEGSRETEDVGAALRFLLDQSWVDRERIALAGFSFGSRMIFSYLREHPDEHNIKAAVAVGMPVSAWDISHLGHWPGPKIFISGDQDEYGPAPELTRFVETLPRPALRVQLKGVGHFLPNREWEAGAIAANFLTPILGLNKQPVAP